MPVPRNSMQLDYSRWQQNLIGVLQVDISYTSQIEIGNVSAAVKTFVNYDSDIALSVAPRTKITLDARLAYRNKGDLDNAWKPYAASIVERILDCSIDKVGTFTCVTLFVHICLLHAVISTNL